MSKYETTESQLTRMAILGELEHVLWTYTPREIHAVSMLLRRREEPPKHDCPEYGHNQVYADRMKQFRHFRRSIRGVETALLERWLAYVIDREMCSHVEVVEMAHFVPCPTVSSMSNLQEALQRDHEKNLAE